MRDNFDLMVQRLGRLVELLEQQELETTGTDDDDSDTPVTQEVNIEGQGVSSRVGVIEPRDYIVIESDDLDDDEHNDDGTVTLQPGETKTLVRYEGDPFALHAVGATDEAGVQYRLVAGSKRTVGGTTNSPLGLLNDPFSFGDVLGGALGIDKRIEYRATLDAEATAPVNLAGRLHVEVFSG